MTQRELLDFLNKVSVLKTNTRHCYTLPDRKESVADHSWRLALIPLLIESEFPDVDINKVIRMCLIHDLGEAVTGDIPAFFKTDSDEAKEDMALDRLIGTLPDDVEKKLTDLYDEMDALETPEAKLYKALDNMEAVISHNESLLSTWIPLEYDENIRYGEENVSYNEWLVKLKEECNKDSLKKIAEGK